MWFLRYTYTERKRKQHVAWKDYSQQAKVKAIFAPIGQEAIREATSLSLVWVYP